MDHDIRSAPATLDTSDGGPVWAMPLVVRLERGNQLTAEQVLSAAGSAVAGVLDSAEAEPGGLWHPSVTSWTDGRIRKVVRRARGTAWQRAAELPGITGTCGSAQVRAYPPTIVDQVPAAIGKLQVTGLDVPGGLPAQAPGRRLVVVALNPDVTATTGKWVAQVGHGAQLVLAQLDPADRAAWATLGYPVAVTRPAPAHFAQLAATSSVVIHDAGFTEVAPGTLTAVAHWNP